MNNLKEGEDDEGEREWRAPRGSRQHHPPSESHSEKCFEQLLGDGGGKRKRRVSSFRVVFPKEFSEFFEEAC
jgi:hypothetical protein